MQSIKEFGTKGFICFFASLVFALFINAVKAQNGSKGLNPTMTVSNLDKNTENPMKLEDLKIDIKVIGDVAVTTLDMSYYNANSRVMEGEFSFPLGEGQTVSRFALDINGTLREGVVVEKEKGRKTFEAIVRRRIDPGLLEMTEGNNFRSRVYPLPAHGRRRIVIAFEQTLVDKGKDLSYLLPLNIKEAVAHFKVHAEVVKNDVLIDKTQNELSNISFSKWNESYIADFEKADFTPDKQIALRFPRSDKEPWLYTAHKGNDTSYFYVNVHPEIVSKAKVLPTHITLLWDKSQSAHSRNIEKELLLLDAYIKKTEILTIDLVPFALKTDRTQSFVITKGNWDNLKAVLLSMVYDGATSLGSINLTSYKCDEILLFSDGMSNYGKAEPLIGSIPVTTINSTLVANHSILNYIAQKSGGVYINCNILSNEDAVLLLTNAVYQFISADSEMGKLFTIYPSMPTPCNGSFTLAGLMKGNNASLVLHFGIGKTVLYSKTITISATNGTDSLLLGRLWAEKKIAELSLTEDKNKDEITRTGKAYGIVTRNTSLIVLESLRDYILYNIVPPKEMQQDYFNQVRTNESLVKERQKAHIENVVQLSDIQSAWWKTDYPLPIVQQLTPQTTGTNQASVNQTRITPEISKNNTPDPLYIIDGKPQNGVPHVNPQKIKSISVIKDQNELAKYGPRASNGVILITLKDSTKVTKTKKPEASIVGTLTITGTFTDGEFGGGLPGANVILKGTTVGTSTDINGQYSIKVIDKNSILVYSSIGFKAQSIKVGNRNVIDVTLKKDVQQIEQVVKVGYGIQKKSDVTGSVTQLGGADIADRPVIGVDQAMQGKASNVTVTSGSAVNSAMVRIRGTGTINPSNSMSEVNNVKAEDKGAISLNAWDPQTPYLKVLEYANKGHEYQTYLKLKEEYGATPSFYIDASDFFAKKEKIDTAVLIISNLAELSLESPQLLRVLAEKLLVLNRTAEAVIVYEKLLQLKGEEPQSYRDLGLAYEANGEHQKALDTLYEVVKKEWDSRFNGIELIVMNDINAIICANSKLHYSYIDKRLVKKEAVDIRVLLTWDTDNCDMDLWVTDQTNEKCFYGHKLTTMGGKLSNDFTGGYGPEEFMIKKASQGGKYIIQSNYYGTRSQSILAPVNLHMQFFSNYGRANQTEKEVVIRLDNKTELIDVGSFIFN
jgi:TonB-dependent SusC/RagA subfamily outer membrane receptor